MFRNLIGKGGGGGTTIIKVTVLNCHSPLKWTGGLWGEVRAKEGRVLSRDRKFRGLTLGSALNALHLRAQTGSTATVH